VVSVTGQTKCYDSAGREVPCPGTGQDGELRCGLPWPEPRFVVNGETALDRLTGLEWPRNANPAELPLTWQEAMDYVEELNRSRYLGQDDWRMPNRGDLRSLVSYQDTRPVLPRHHPFENLFPSWYWTSTTAAIAPAHAWYVNLDGGRMFYGGKDQSFMVWPVRGIGNGTLPATGQRCCWDANGALTDCAGSRQDGALRFGAAWPRHRFQRRDDAVLDRLTGLLWRRAADLTQGPVAWEQALAAVADLARHQGVPWRLPNINELESLVDCSAHSPALPGEAPFSDLREAYWSSTTSTYETDWGWALYLGKGATGVGQKGGCHFHVWAVRGAV
jgi:hypothetical protein